MIDLSTLIALLTALAAATTSTGAGPVEPGTAGPPSQHCRVTSPTPTDPARSDGTARRPESPGTGALPPPDVPDERPGTSPDVEDSRGESPQRLRSDSDDGDDDGDENDKNDKGQSDEPGSGRTDETSDRAASRGPSTTPKPQPTAPERPRSPSAEPSTADREAVPDSGSDSAGSGRTERPPTRIPPSGGTGTDDTGTDDTGAGTDGRESGTGRSVEPPPSTRSRHPTDDRCADPLPSPSGSDPRDPDPADPAPAPDPSDDAPATDVETPSDLVDLGNWYLTLPTGPAGDPDTVQPAQLAGYSSDYFRLNQSRDGVVFTAPVTGATTKNSHYPRSELREMNGTEEAAWSNATGTHTLRATEAVTELPESKPELVTAQIHGGDDDVMQIRLEGSHLMVQYADGAKQVMLDPDYRLGIPYDIEIVAAAHSVQVSYNGSPKAELPLSGSTWYFKAGAYVQSNPSKGDAAGAAGQVIIYALEVDHR